MAKKKVVISKIKVAKIDKAVTEKQTKTQIIEALAANTSISKKRQGRNPATGEAITIKAKPATTVIKIRALKILKDSITA